MVRNDTRPVEVHDLVTPELVDHCDLLVELVRRVRARADFLHLLDGNRIPHERPFEDDAEAPLTQDVLLSSESCRNVVIFVFVLAATWICFVFPVRMFVTITTMTSSTTHVHDCTFQLRV